MRYNGCVVYNKMLKLLVQANL